MLAAHAPYSDQVWFLTIVTVAALLLAACGGDAGSSRMDEAGLPAPQGENAGVVQFLRDYYLLYEAVYSGRLPPAKLIEQYAQHCTEDLKPGALDVFALAQQLERPAANATKVLQVDVGDVTVEPVYGYPDYFNVTLAGERNLRFLVDGTWLSGEQFESRIRARTPLSAEPVTRELLRVDGKLYISDCDFARGLPARR
jgi:hypothetical protein